MHGVGGALLIGQGRRAGATVDIHTFLLGSHLGSRQRGARVGAAKQHGHALCVDPFARLGGGDVGLVLVVRADQFDRHAQHLAAKVVDGHLNRHGTVLALHVGIQAGHVGDETDLDFVLRVDGRSGQAGCAEHQCECLELVFHECLLLW